MEPSRRVSLKGLKTVCLGPTRTSEGIGDIHVIDVYLTNARSSTWVLDTGSVANICNSKQGLLPLEHALVFP